MTRTRTRPSRGALVPREPLTAPTPLFICAECRYAQLFAVQPRALCTREGSVFRDKVVFAGQPACAQVVLRTSADPAAARCSPGGKRISRRFAAGT